MGSAYLGGAVAKATVDRAKAERLAEAARSGYSDQALIAAAGGLDQAALTVARRHDPYTMAGGAERDHQAVTFAARIAPPESDSLRAGLRNVSLHLGPPAQPFRFSGALDASRDLDCLTQAVYWEARGEGVSGMQAVAQVVLNRVRHPAFPKTVCGVVFQGAADGDCQFSFACEPRQTAAADDAWDRARTIAARALSGHVMSEVGSATHFHATRVAPSWGDTMLKVAQIGSHIFYRFGAGGTQPKTFRYTPEPNKAPEALPPVLASLVPSFGAPTTGSDGKAGPQPIAYQILEKVLPGADKPAPSPETAATKAAAAMTVETPPATQP